MTQAPISSLRLNDLTPAIALALFHNAWSKAVEPNSPPPLILLCETNAITIKGRFDTHDIKPMEFLKAYGEISGLKVVGYTNGVVLFPSPCYDCEIVSKNVPVPQEAAAQLQLEQDGNEHVEERLRTFGVTFPFPGCEAVLTRNGASLHIIHVPAEIAKVEFLINQAARGVSVRDVAIDPTLHLAPFHFRYERGSWTKSIRDGTSQPSVPSKPQSPSAQGADGR